MQRYYGGQPVPAGVYLNLSTGEPVQLSGDVRILPAAGKVRYLKVPQVLAAIGSPFAGLVFILSLPFVAIAGIVGFMAQRAVRLGSELGRRALQPVFVGWRPGRAYLTRKGAASGQKKSVSDSEFPNLSISEIEEEITRRRNQGEK